MVESSRSHQSPPAAPRSGSNQTWQAVMAGKRIRMCFTGCRITLNFYLTNQIKLVNNDLWGGCSTLPRAVGLSFYFGELFHFKIYNDSMEE